MRFEIYRGGNRDWYWRLRAANSKIVATGGEGYRRTGSIAAILRKAFGGELCSLYELDKAIAQAKAKAQGKKVH